ncbi:MAG: aminotransferase class V-fold PLP-dependent enzyme [Candidatus Nanohaloarchaea archaeon]
MYRHEKQLTDKMVSGLEKLDVKVLNQGAGIVSVIPGSMSCNEASEILNRRGVKVRSGQHCVHPWFKGKKFDSTLRASMHLYNNEEDVEKFLTEMKKVSLL